MKRMAKIDVEFKNNFILSRPLNWVMNYWNYENRVRPFSYPPVKNNKNCFVLCLVIIFLISTVAFFVYVE